MGTRLDPSQVVEVVCERQVQTMAYAAEVHQSKRTGSLPVPRRIAVQVHSVRQRRHASEGAFQADLECPAAGDKEESVQRQRVHLSYHERGGQAKIAEPHVQRQGEVGIQGDVEVASPEVGVGMDAALQAELERCRGLDIVASRDADDAVLEAVVHSGLVRHPSYHAQPPVDVAYHIPVIRGPGVQPFEEILEPFQILIEVESLYSRNGERGIRPRGRPVAASRLLKAGLDVVEELPVVLDEGTPAFQNRIDVVEGHDPYAGRVRDDDVVGIVVLFDAPDLADEHKVLRECAGERLERLLVLCRLPDALVDVDRDDDVGTHRARKLYGQVVVHPAVDDVSSVLQLDDREDEWHRHRSPKSVIQRS